MPKFFTTKKTGMTLSEVNVIPLVDIVFTLLIIFMIMAPMIHKGVEVQVPESSAGEMLPKEQRHLVSLTKDGALWFDDQETSLEELETFLRDLPATETIYLQSDAAVPYGSVMAVISEIKTHGGRNVGLVTSPRRDQLQRSDENSR